MKHSLVFTFTAMANMIVKFMVSIVSYKVLHKSRVI